MDAFRKPNKRLDMGETYTGRGRQAVEMPQGGRYLSGGSETVRWQLVPEDNGIARPVDRLFEAPNRTDSGYANLFQPP